MLHGLVAESSILRSDAIQALALRSDQQTAGLLLDVYSDLNQAERQDAIGVMGTRREFAAALLTAIENGTVSRRDVSAFALQQLRAFKDTRTKERVDALWADDARQLRKSDQIARYKQQMTPEYLKHGDARAGR